MYFLLGKEIADVDPTWFDKIGYIRNKVLALPVIDQVIALRSAASTEIDHIVDCQNTLFLHLTSPDVDRLSWEEWREHTLEPGAVYRYLGDEKVYKGQHFVELKSEVPLGQLILSAYFLVPVVDCEFAAECGDSADWGRRYTFQELCSEGFFKSVLGRK